MTGRYVKEIPRAGEEGRRSMDKELCEPDIQTKPLQ